MSVIQEGSRAIAEAQTTPPNLDLPHFILHQVLGLTGAEQAALFPLDNQGERQLLHTPPPFSPSLVVDIPSVWEREMEAVAAYTSQSQSDGSGLETALDRPDFTRFLKARALSFGAIVGAAYGEPFLTPGPVPLHELPGIGDPDRA